MTLERIWTIASSVTVGSGGAFAMMNLDRPMAWPPFLGTLICFGIAIAGIVRNERRHAHDAALGESTKESK